MSIEFLLRLIGMIVLGIAGWQLGGYLVGSTNLQTLDPAAIRYVISLALAGAALGLLLTPWVTTRPIHGLRNLIRQLPSQQLIAGIIGLITGQIIAALLALPLSLLPKPLGQVLPFVGSILCGYLGVSVMVMRRKDILDFFGRVGRGESALSDSRQVLLDTSVIIDGRIADISQTGFIQGTMVIPRFILNELQQIADSSDALRRNRGRRGLEVLNRLQKDSIVPIRITDMDVEDVREVDAKLIVLAQRLRCPIITNDYNLNRVAELQGVTVLNINELANAVRAVLLPGETLKVRIIQEGKELGQGVGYLDDGTMVVVEDGRRDIGRTIEVIVTKVLQTSAGRMIFASPLR